MRDMIFNREKTERDFEWHISKIRGKLNSSISKIVEIEIQQIFIEADRDKLVSDRENKINQILKYGL